MAKTPKTKQDYIDAFVGGSSTSKPATTTKKSNGGNWGGSIMRSIGSHIPKAVRKTGVKVLSSGPVSGVLRAASVPSSAAASAINAGVNTFTQSRLGRAYWSIGRGDEAARFKQKANAIAYHKRGGFLKSSLNQTGLGDVVESFVPTNEDTVKKAAKGIYSDKEVNDYLSGKKGTRVAQAVSGDKNATFKGTKGTARMIGGALDTAATVMTANAAKVGIGEKSAERIAREASAREALAATKEANKSIAKGIAKYVPGRVGGEAHAAQKEIKTAKKVAKVASKPGKNLSRREIATRLQKAGDNAAAELAANRKYGKISKESLDKAGLQAGVNIKGVGIVGGKRTAAAAKNYLGKSRYLTAASDAIGNTQTGESVRRTFEKYNGMVDMQRDYGKAVRWSTEDALLASKRAGEAAGKSWERGVVAGLTGKERRFVRMARNGAVITDALENPTKAAALEKRMPGLLDKLKSAREGAFKSQEENLGVGNILHRANYVPHTLSPEAKKAARSGRKDVRAAIRVAGTPDALQAHPRLAGYKQYLGEATDGTVTSMNAIARKKLGVDFDLFDTSFVGQKEATKKSISEAARGRMLADQAVERNLPGSGWDARVIDKKKLRQRARVGRILTDREKRLAAAEAAASKADAAAGTYVDTVGRTTASGKVIGKGKVRYAVAEGLQTSAKDAKTDAGTLRRLGKGETKNAQRIGGRLATENENVAKRVAVEERALANAEAARADLAERSQIPVGEHVMTGDTKRESALVGGKPVAYMTGEQRGKVPEVVPGADKRIGVSPFRTYGTPGVEYDPKNVDQATHFKAYRQVLRNDNRKTITDFFKRNGALTSDIRKMIRRADPTEFLHMSSAWKAELKKAGLSGDQIAKFQADLELALSKNHVRVTNVLNDRLAIIKAGDAAGPYIPKAIEGGRIPFSMHPESQSLIRLAQDENPQFTAQTIADLRRVQRDGRNLTPAQAADARILASARVDRYKQLRALQVANRLNDAERQELGRMEAFARQVRLAEGVGEKQLPTERIYNALLVVARRNEDAAMLAKGAEGSLSDLVRIGVKDRNRLLGEAKAKGMTLEEYLQSRKRGRQNVETVADIRNRRKAEDFAAARQEKLASDTAAMQESRNPIEMPERPDDVSATADRRTAMLTRRAQRAWDEARLTNDPIVHQRLADAMAELHRVTGGDALPRDWERARQIAEENKVRKDAEAADRADFEARRENGRTLHAGVLNDARDRRAAADKKLKVVEEKVNAAEEARITNKTKKAIETNRLDEAKVRLRELRATPVPRRARDADRRAAQIRHWQTEGRKARGRLQALERERPGLEQTVADAKAAFEDAKKKNAATHATIDGSIQRSIKNNVDYFAKEEARTAKKRAADDLRIVTEDMSKTGKVTQAEVKAQFTPEALAKRAEEIRNRTDEMKSLQTARGERKKFDVRSAEYKKTQEAKAAEESAAAAAEAERVKVAQRTAEQVKGAYEGAVKTQRAHEDMVNRINARKFGDVGGPTMNDAEQVARTISPDQVPDHLKGIAERLRSGSAAATQAKAYAEAIAEAKDRVAVLKSPQGLSGDMAKSAAEQASQSVEVQALENKIKLDTHWFNVFNAAAKEEAPQIEELLKHYSDTVAPDVAQQHFAAVDKLRGDHAVAVGNLPEPLRDKYVVRDGQILPAAEPLIEVKRAKGADPTTRSLMTPSVPLRRKGSKKGPKPRLSAKKELTAEMKAGQDARTISKSAPGALDPSKTIPLRSASNLPSVTANPIPDFPEVNMPDRYTPIDRPNRRFGNISQDTGVEHGPAPVTVRKKDAQRVSNLEKQYSDAAARTASARGKAKDVAQQQQDALSEAMRYQKSAEELSKQGEEDLANANRLIAGARAASAELTTASEKHASAKVVYDGIDFMTWRSERDKGLARWGNPTRNGQLLLDRDFGDALTRAVNYTVKEHGALVNFADRLMGQWKAMALLSPGFHIRNAFGGLFNNYLAGVDNATYGLFLSNYKRVMSAGGDTSVIPNPQIRRAFDEMISRGAIATGGTNLMAADAAKSVGTARWNPLYQANRVNMVVGGGVEDTLRGSLFLDDYLKGMSGDDAFQRTIKFHYDGENMSRFESDVVRRVIPFYSFFRNNFPLQVEMVAKNPQKYLAWQRMFGTLGTDQPDPNRPDYRLSPESIRFMKDVGGNPTYLTPQTMITDPQKFMRWDWANGHDPIHEALQLPGPIPQAIYEGVAGKKITSGTPYDYMNPEPATGATGALAKMLGMVDQNGNMSARTYNNLKRALPILSNDPLFFKQKKWDRENKKAVPDNAKQLEAISSKLLGMQMYENTPERAALSAKIKAKKAGKSSSAKSKAEYIQNFVDGKK